MAFNSALGFGAVWLLNLTTSVTGLSLGLNWFNALLIGILGLPGFGLLLLVQWVLTYCNVYVVCKVLVNMSLPGRKAPVAIRPPFIQGRIFS